MQINFNARGTAGRDGGSMLLDQVIGDIATAFKRFENGAGVPLGYAPLNAAGLIDPSFTGDTVTSSTLMVSAPSGLNAPVTATLPAVSGKVHLITAIQIVRVATAALAGTAILTYASTNLPGGPAWTAGNLIAAGQAILDLDYQPAFPLRSVAAGVATTITAPAAGANVAVRINVSYLLGSP